MQWFALFFTTTVLLAVCRCATVARPKLLAKIDNSIEVNDIPSKRLSSPPRFVTLTKMPKEAYAHYTGAPVELTCEAIGAPAPTIHWFRNDRPVYEHDMESNEIIDINPTSLARLSSTLLVPRTEGQDKYTCLVTSGYKVVKASTIVYSADDSTDLSEREKLSPLKPRILVSYKAFVDSIGSNIVLPCRAKGHPRPHVTWKDKSGVVIRRDTPRMKVLRSGELVISSLRFSDMGDYTCQASNAFGTQLATTFVYPAKAG